MVFRKPDNELTELQKRNLKECEDQLLDIRLLEAKAIYYAEQFAITKRMDHASKMRSAIIDMEVKTHRNLEWQKKHL